MVKEYVSFHTIYIEEGVRTPSMVSKQRMAMSVPVSKAYSLSL